MSDEHVLTNDLLMAELGFHVRMNPDDLRDLANRDPAIRRRVIAVLRMLADNDPGRARALAREIDELIELLRSIGEDDDVYGTSEPVPLNDPFGDDRSFTSPDYGPGGGWPGRKPKPAGGAGGAGGSPNRPSPPQVRPGIPMGAGRGQSQPEPAAEPDDAGLPSWLTEDFSTGALPPRSADGERYLLAHLPYRAPQHSDISLTVRVCRRPADWASAASPVRMQVPKDGMSVTVLVHAPPGLLPTESSEQVLYVPPDGDSLPVRFAFRARGLGPQWVRVLAFAGGTFLAELSLEVSLEPGGPSIDGDLRVATLTDVVARQGEVTLQVRTDGDRTVFQLLSDRYLFEPVLAEATAGDPPAAVERAIGTLRQLALGRGPYSAGMARRWMRETGIGLWHEVVPGLIKDQFWQLRDQITSFTVATSHDVLPWELLYPLRQGADDGFMVEQFPVLRRVFGQQRSHRMTIAPATYVVSGNAPANARQEIDTLASVIGTAGVVRELGHLLDIVASGQCGPLHFVCHNSFDNASGSSIAMDGGPFVPGLLNSAVIERSLAALHPLVFVNACRTAGTALEYSRMIGWAQQFMAAGAGAFVGTLWPVRSESASLFAHAFYELLRDGQSLGDAAMRARRMAMHDEPDPTWLAYTVYGDPHAHARG